MIANVYASCEEAHVQFKPSAVKKKMTHQHVWTIEERKLEKM